MLLNGSLRRGKNKRAMGKTNSAFKKAKYETLLLPQILCLFQHLTCTQANICSLCAVVRVGKNIPRTLCMEYLLKMNEQS